MCGSCDNPAIRKLSEFLGHARLGHSKCNKQIFLMTLEEGTMAVLM